MVWADLSGTALRVSARVNHSLTAVPDRADASESAPTSGRIYLFGGDDGQSPRNDCWVYDVARDEWEEPELRGERPSPRSRHSMTLVRHFRAETQTEDERLYLYGGVGTHTEVVHYLDLATRTWVTPTPVGEEVLPLLGHTAAAIGAELWVFGGRDARRSYNHVWKLDTTTHEWASFRGAHAPTGMVPPPSSKHVMSVQGTKLLVVLGELPPEKVFLYETTSNAWLQAAVANPQGAPELHRGAAAFIGEELHVFGGLDVAANNPTNTMHLLDTRVMEWHTAAAGGATPTERVGHAMCALGACLFVFGGLETGGSHSASFGRYDAWALLWEVPRPDGTSPSARVGHAIASLDEQLYVYGGASGGRPLGEVYVHNTRTSYWEKAIPDMEEVHGDPSCSAPMPIVGHAMAAIDVAPGSQLAKDNFKFVGQKLLVFGGGDGRKASRDSWLIDVKTLVTRQLVARGTPPTERVGHAACLVRGRMFYVFGGFVRKLGYMFDLHCLDLQSVMWSQVAVGGVVPDGRINHSLAALEKGAGEKRAKNSGVLYLFGGAFKGVPFGDLYRVDEKHKEWEKLEPSGLTPEPRSGHSANFIGRRMYVYGGQCGGGRWLNELVVLDADGLLWSRPRTSAPPRARSQHAAAIVGTRLLIFGGAQGGTFLSDLSILDVASASTTAPLPSAGTLAKPPPAADALSSAVAGASSSTVIVPVGEEGVPAPKMKKGVTFGASSKMAKAVLLLGGPKAGAAGEGEGEAAAEESGGSPSKLAGAASTALVLAGSRKSSLKRRGSSAADFPGGGGGGGGVGGGVARRAVAVAVSDGAGVAGGAAAAIGRREEGCVRCGGATRKGEGVT